MAAPPVYITQDDLTAGGLSPVAIRTLGPDVIAAAFSQASRTADLYLAERYSLPLVTWGDDLRQMVVQIAVYRLLCRRAWNPSDPNNAGIVALYKQALADLNAIKQGLLSLDVTETSSDPTEEPDIWTQAPRGYADGDGYPGGNRSGHRI